MTVLFYRHDGGMPFAMDSILPTGLAFRVWSPEDGGLPRTMLQLVWWAMERLGGFARRGFTEISIRRGERMLHRLIVTPRWYRFPFMAPEDLQIGAVWTAPEARGQGLARAAIAEAHRRFGARTRFWYVVDAGNAASVALIESCGYRLVGKGRRTRPLGLGLLGRFRLPAV